MIPNLGTKGNGEPVVQPAEPKSTAVACWRVPTVRSLIGFVIAGWISLTLTSCTTSQGLSSFEASPLVPMSVCKAHEAQSGRSIRWGWAALMFRT